ncbi:MAG: type I 3-dehydroquinate dehydratase [Candidatus Aenigmarchaeota archaeon]|nr:type I 3-dehydroquinate dehydratase [Candidatus Aenigmarchaeota archaeon]
MKKVKINDLIIGEKPILLCTVLEENVESTIESAKKAFENGADCIELRIDKLKDNSMIKEVIKKIEEPKLLVCRPKDWDGFFEGSEGDRVERLLIAIENGADAVDVELKTPYNLREKIIKKAKQKGIPVLIAYENFEKTPTNEELLNILKEEQKLGADIAKFAVIAKDYNDMIRVLQVVLEAKKFLDIPFVAIAMGKFGSASRSLSCVLGSSMTYCTVEKGKEGAPGQLPVKDTRMIIELLS